MQFSMTVLAYLGPETMLPMTSIVAGVVGVVMMFGRASLRWASGAARGVVAMARPRPKSPARSRRIGQGPVIPGGVPESAANQAQP